MASCNKETCNHRKKTWLKKYENTQLFLHTCMQLRITRLRKYPIDPKAYLGRWSILFGEMIAIKMVLDFILKKLHQKRKLNKVVILSDSQSSVGTSNPWVGGYTA